VIATRRLLLAIGNRDRGDDGIAATVVDAAAARLPADVEMVRAPQDTAALLDRLDGVAALVVVDACRSGAAPGTVHRFEAHAAPLPAATFGWSSHALSIAQTLELARTLALLPPVCVVYAVEGAQFALGAGLSPAVAAAADGVAARIIAEFASHPS
jgi:hydrogenase maturation protease